MTQTQCIQRLREMRDAIRDGAEMAELERRMGDLEDAMDRIAEGEDMTAVLNEYGINPWSKP